MRDFDEASYDELVRIDTFELSDKELNWFVKRLVRERDLKLTNVVPSVSALNEQIERAQHEQSSRSAAKLSKVSIIIATFAVIISAVGIVLQLFT